MRDYPHYNPMEQIAAVRPLDRLDQELSVVRDMRSMDVAIGKYISDEMQLPYTTAMHTVEFLKESGVFPLRLEYVDESQEMALEDKYRIGIFTGIKPLYQRFHSTGEFAEWLPRALDVVLPISGNHGTHANCHEVVDEYACWTQDVCPLKMILAETKEDVLCPDFDSFAYIAKPEDTRDQVSIVLSVLENKGILLKSQRTQLLGKYIEKYNKVFSVPR
jgi:hypothetical protein